MGRRGHYIEAPRGHLQAVNDCCGHGVKNELPDPLPINLLLAMVGAALTAQALYVAMSLLIGFHALLRITEIINIQASHFTFPQRCGLVLLVLPLTKSGQSLQNVQETVTITEP